MFSARRRLAREGDVPEPVVPEADLSAS
jgi:hypothetical protein